MFYYGSNFGGVGASLTANVGPLYMNEIAPPVYRAMIVGLYVSGYYVGGIVISCALLGGSYLPGNWSWRMPVLLQIVPSLLVVLLVFLVTPESPCYLVAKGTMDEARRVLANCHTTSGDVNEETVSVEMEKFNSHWTCWTTSRGISVPSGTTVLGDVDFGLSFSTVFSNNGMGLAY